MFARRARRRFLFLGMLAAFALALSCGDKKKPTEAEPSPYLPQTSPENVLANLRRAYVARDRAEYRRLFAANFDFHFHPTDLLNPEDPCPASWDLAAELQSADSLFRDPRVVKVELSFVPEEPASAADSLPGSVRVEVKDIDLSVLTTLEDGTPIRRIVSSGHSTFFLMSLPGEADGDGHPAVRIVRWYDRGFSGEGNRKLLVERITWGRLKHHYSRP